jgi:hypothetical protein
VVYGRCIGSVVARAEQSGELEMRTKAYVVKRVEAVG